MSQLRFALLRLIPAGFHRDGRVRGSTLRSGLQHIRAHGGARKALCRGETTGIHSTSRCQRPCSRSAAGERMYSLLRFFFFFFLISAVRRMSAETCESSDCIHPACLGTALRRFYRRAETSRSRGRTDGGRWRTGGESSRGKKSSIRNMTGMGGGDVKGEMNETHTLCLSIYLSAYSCLQKIKMLKYLLLNFKTRT